MASGLLASARRLLIVVALVIAACFGSPPAMADSQATQGEAYMDCVSYAEANWGTHVSIPCHIPQDNPSQYAFCGSGPFGNTCFRFPFVSTCASQPSATHPEEWDLQTTCENGCDYQASGSTTVNGQLMTLYTPSGQVCNLPNPQAPPVSAAPVVSFDDNNGRTCSIASGDLLDQFCGNPINSGTGNKLQVETDIPANGLLGFVRYYNSAITAFTHAFGQHWTNTYTRRVQNRPDDPNTALVLRPDGQANKFVFANGAWASAAHPQASLQRTLDSAGITTGWIYQSHDGREVENFDALGRLTSIVLADGQSVALVYNYGFLESSANDYLLTSVQRQDGRRLEFSYNTNRLLDQVTDSANATITYSYDASGRLATVTYPGSASKTYFYNESVNTSGADLPTALTGIQDELGVRFAIFKYQADGKAISTEHAGQTNKFAVSYGQSGNTVTLPSGVVQSRTFVSPQGVVRPGTTSMPVGGATRTHSYTYDANGFPDVATDPLLTTTDYDYDGSGRLSQVVESANVVATKRTTETYWHASFDVPTERRILGPAGALEAKSTWTYNSRGQVVTASAVHLTNSALSRTTTFTYCEDAGVSAGTCPIVGLLLSVDGPRTDVADVTTFTYRQADDSTCATSPTTCPYRKGDLWKVTNALGQVSEMVAYDGAQRPLSVKDVNGVVTNFEYNARGWLTAPQSSGN